MDRFRHILRYTVSTIAILFLALVITLQLPSVQTWIAHKVIDKFSDKINGTVTLKGVHIRPFNTVIIDGLTIVDNKPCNATARDTLCNIGMLSVKYSLADLLTGKSISLDEVTLKDATLNLVIENVDSTGYNTNLHRIFRLPPNRKAKPLPDKDLVHVKAINISNFTYRMQNYAKILRKFPDTAIQWDDVDVTRMDATVRDFRISHRIWSGELTKMSLSEKCGWNVDNLTASARVGNGLVDICDFKLTDGFSEVNLDVRLYGHPIQYKHYNDSVRMVVDMKPSRWSGWTMARFIPPFTPDQGTMIDLEGHAEGYVRDMKGENLRLRTENRNLSLTLDGRISNLPDYMNANVDVRFSRLSFNTRDVFHVLGRLLPQVRIKAAKRLSNTVPYRGSIALKGDLNNLDADLSLLQKGTEGTLDATANLKNLKKYNPAREIQIGAYVKSNGFNIGNVINNKLLGAASIETYASLSIPRKLSSVLDMTVQVDSLNIDGFEFKGHNYTGIRGTMNLEDGDITADLRSDSQDLRADLTVWSDKYSYNGSISIQHANLKAMNLDKREVSEIGMDLYARIDRDLKHPSGNVNMSNIRLTNAEGTTRIGNIAAEASSRNGIYDINLESGVINGTFSGNKNSFEGTAEFMDSTPLLAFIYPGLYVEKGSRAQIEFNENGNLKGSLMSGRVALKKHYIKDLNLDVNGTLDDLHITAISTNIHALDFNLGNNVINIDKNGNRFDAQYTFFNSEERMRDGNISASMLYNGPGDFELSIDPSSFCLNNYRWNLSESHIAYKKGDLDIRNFELTNEQQEIKLDGRLSRQDQDTLKADIKDFDLSIIDQLWTKFNLGLKGRLNLDGTIYSPISKGIPLVDMTIRVDSLSTSGGPVGSLYANSEYNPEKDTFSISLNDKLEGHNVLSASATIWPGSSEIEAYASFEKFPIGWPQSFIPTVFSRMDGTVSGNVSLDGPLKKMRMRCRNGRIENAELDVTFTKVPYTLDGEFHIDDKGIHLDKAVGMDRFGSKANGYGGLEWDHMRKLNLNITFHADNVESLNMPHAAEDGVFYGHVFGSGKVNFNGPFHHIKMTGDVHSPTNSDLYIIVPNQHVAAKTNLLTFVDPYDMEADPYQQILEKFKRKERKANFDTELHCLVGTGLRVHVDMDNTGFAAGISGIGNGEIRMSTNAKEGFRIFGDYTMQEGTMGFNVTRIVKRNFTMRNGSTIKFGDDIFQSDLDLFGSYETKASISTLVADNSSVENRRQVECGVHITGKMENPYLDFSINVPDLNPSIKSQVESALDTEDKVQKQFLSILIAGSFLPGDMGGIVNGSSLLYSNMSEIMASQVNNIFNKLNIPLDLGLKYQPTETGLNLFDVAVSTQLFHNRVIIGGTFGNRQNQGVAGGTEMFGDLDIEYKVNNSGTFRVKAFSHAADQYSNFLDNAQRNGVGLTWQQEFDRFSRWITNLFKKKEARQQAEADEITEGRKTKEIILDE